jgi:chemotaxis protein CheD
LGEVFLAKKPTAIRTILGSCVAVIFHVPRLKVSALCHAVLPEQNADGSCREFCPHPCKHRAPAEGELRYVTCCIRKMLNDLDRLHVDKAEIVTTLVGGANVLEALDRRWSVADRNVEVAVATLEKQGIRIQYRDSGGNLGRSIEHLSDLNRTTVRYHRSEPQER